MDFHAITYRIKGSLKFIKNCGRFDKQKVASMMFASLCDDVNRLRDMILGYECEEEKALLDELQETITSLYTNDESTKDRMIEICDKLSETRYELNVVGFDKEVEMLLDHITHPTQKFQTFSIVGMPGVGKTTLVRKLYNDPLIKNMFDIRLWICVSEVNCKTDLLLSILSNFDNKNSMMDDTSVEELGEKLTALFEGHKYLVVLDDIRDFEVWNDVEGYFPKDETRSQVVLTSRDTNVSSLQKSYRYAHMLCRRTHDESWKIFKKKVFRTEKCPQQLKKLGKAITRKCEGLPLAVIVASGLAKDNLSTTWWNQIADTFMNNDPSQCMGLLALSYNHLPPHLRQCFLFFGSFPVFYEVSLNKLIWLWIAYGLSYETGNRTLEDAAKHFLMDVETRNMRLKKTEDGHPSPYIYKYVGTLDSAPSSTITNMLQKMSSGHVALPTHSGLCYPFELCEILQKGGSINIEKYCKSLKILDMEYVPLSVFPSVVVEFTDLRYLAIQAHNGSPPPSISKLVNLQTLVISSKENIVVLKTIWNMVNLRHIYIKSGENLVEEPKDDFPLALLASLQTLSQVSPQSCENISSRAPNLRKLGFCGPVVSSLGDLEFPNIRSLVHLHKLNLFSTFCHPKYVTRSCDPIMFPENLKKLTLSKTDMNWEEMQTFALLPNLEVLSLKLDACFGPTWEMQAAARFERLKVLKLHDLKIMEWVGSRYNLPRLRRLVIHRCLRLEKIRLSLKLKEIEVKECSIYAHEAALKLRKTTTRENKVISSM